MRDTPMTDEVIGQMCKPYETADVDMVLNLCRTLERQLAEAQARIRELKAYADELNYRLEGGGE